MARPSRGACLWNRQLGYGEYFDRIHLTLHADKDLEAADSPYLRFKVQGKPLLRGVPEGTKPWLSLRGFSRQRLPCW